MHPVNRYFFISILLIPILALISSCSDDPINDHLSTPGQSPDQPAEPHSNYLNVADTFLLDYKEGKDRIIVDTDVTYSVFLDSDWLSAEVLPQGVYINLRFSANETTEERNAELIIKSDAGILHKVVIKQDFETKIDSTEYKIGNALLDEKSIVWIKLNRKIKSVTPYLKSLWLNYYKPIVKLLDDKQTIEITGLQGIGSNYTYLFEIDTDYGYRHSILHDIWFCDQHWDIDGRLTGFTVRTSKPDHAYAITKFQNRLYAFNSYNGEPYFSFDLGYTPTALSYSPLTDEVYVLGNDVKLHVYDANDGSFRRDISLPTNRLYAPYEYILITDEGWGIVATEDYEKYMIDVTCDDKIYTLPGFDNSLTYRDIVPSYGSDGKIWFSTLDRQLYRIESANGPIRQPARIDGNFGLPGVYGMGGVWATYVWKPGQNKVLISACPGSQAVFNFNTKKFVFHTMIESRDGVGIAFDVTQPASVDRLWWGREAARDFLIVEDKKVIFWSKDTRNPLSSINNLPDGKNMIVSFEGSENDLIKTYFETFDVEKFNASSNFSESYAGW